MDHWFTVEALEPDTYAISEYRHWEETHCYLLCGERLALLIDAGLGVSDLRAVTGRLTDLPVLAAVTHVHWDHIGALGQFSSVAVHAAERDWLAGGFPLPLEVVRRNLTRGHCDFPARVFRGGVPRVSGRAAAYSARRRPPRPGRARGDGAPHAGDILPATAVFMSRSGEPSMPETCSTAAVWTRSIRPPTRSNFGSPSGGCGGWPHAGFCPDITGWTCRRTSRTAWRPRFLIWPPAESCGGGAGRFSFGGFQIRL